MTLLKLAALWAAVSIPVTLAVARWMGQRNAATDRQALREANEHWRRRTGGGGDMRGAI